MSVEIDPQELGFHRPFTVEVQEVLRIKNPNPHPMAFKVKTTAPKQYCVRPNSGRVEPGKEVEVQVILQAMKQEPPMDAKCRDKFLVQSVAITSDKEFEQLPTIWDAVDKSAIQEKKIRVVFLSPRGTAGAAQLATPSKPTTTNGVDATPDTAPPAYSSPSDFRASTVESKYDEPAEAYSPTAAASGASTNAAAAATTTSTREASNNATLEQQLAEAERTIAELKRQDQGGLRQRKASGGPEKPSSSKPAELAQQLRSGTEGVPVKITAVLCLLSFLLAYLFF
ncbi:PapD-like protein [Xylariaceae sp. FL0804]|nr:PapD-like protein [Xylariaceae sp. FL0804]